MTDQPNNSPWMTAAEAGVYLKRGGRFIVRLIKTGALRGAIVSGRGRGEILTRREWLDAWVEDQIKPTPFTGKRRA